MMPVNPYIAGNPVGGSKDFIGRTDVLRNVVDVLRSPHENALVLYGQRRIGKTSILQELIEWLPRSGTYLPIYYDMQYKAARSLPQLLSELATHLAEKIGLPSPTPWGEDVQRAFRDQFLPQVFAQLSSEKSLILLFDEIDVLDNPDETSTSAAFFPYLHDLLSLDPQRLQFVFVIGQRPESLTR